jgi:hypothetical protein
MDEYTKVVSAFREFVTTHALARPAAYPRLTCLHDCNPRTTKFGGKYPLLPAESSPACPRCDQPLMMVVQLYVPALPEFIRSQFPDDRRDQLIVVGVCPECLGSDGYRIAAYSGGDLDRLVYRDDVGEKWSRPPLLGLRRFPCIPNSPPVYDCVDERRQYMCFSGVDGWTETECVPDSSVAAVRKKLREEKFGPPERVLIASHDINMENGLAANCYVGGWPRFCGQDQSPGDDFVLLFSLCESEAATLEWGNSGTAQIWMGVAGKAGEFKFTCSSY